MEEWIKVSGKTVDDAILEASIQLGTSRDNIEYDVLERETRGFLGIGSRPAVIRARKKEEEVDIVSEVFKAPSEKPAKEEKPKKQPKPKKEAEKKETVKKEIKAAVDKNDKPDKKEKAEKKVDRPVKEAKTLDNAAAAGKEKKEKKEKPVSRQDHEQKIPHTAEEMKEASDKAAAFLAEMFAAMGMEVKINAGYSEEVVNIELSGADMGVLIGKRGQTLDSIQYLTSLVVNKGRAGYIRVKVDTEDYRERRKATLENLAKNIAFKVKKTGRPVYLEPMNPYERRIIHAALQADPYVTTHSEGEEPNRKVVVTLKKRERVVTEEE